MELIESFQPTSLISARSVMSCFLLQSQCLVRFFVIQRAALVLVKNVGSVYELSMPMVLCFSPLKGKADIFEFPLCWCKSGGVGHSPADSGLALVAMADQLDLRVLWRPLCFAIGHWAPRELC